MIVNLNELRKTCDKYLRVWLRSLSTHNFVERHRMKKEDFDKFGLAYGTIAFFFEEFEHYFGKHLKDFDDYTHMLRGFSNDDKNEVYWFYELQDTFFEIAKDHIDLYNDEVEFI